MCYIYMYIYVYINFNLNVLTKFSSSRSTNLKYILPWYVKTIPISTRIFISYEMKRDIPFRV